MALIPEPTQTTPNAIYATWETRGVDEPRSHLGASEIGEECARKNWYGFRWAVTHRFTGRMLRLFNRGHREEPVLFDDLRRAGVELHSHQANGEQFEFKMFGGHFAGHYDGVAKGFPEAPNTWHVLEAKTSNQKQFDKLVKEGVRVQFPKHFVQMQIYMMHTGVRRAMYLNVNKNTDEVYAERIEFEPEVAKAYVDKAEGVVFAELPPPRISEKPDFWMCKYCDYYDVCHGPRVPEVNCRTCAHVTPERDGTWSCARPEMDVPIPLALQRTGCGQHRYIPILLDRFAKVKSASDEGNWIHYELRPQYGDGTFTNAAPPGMSSQEIHNQPNPAILGHPAIEAIKAQYPGATLT